MDELWHATILDTKLYADLQEALGLVLHHRPSGASDQESEHRERRLTVMKAIYRANFSTEPLERASLQTSRPQPSPRHLNTISIFVNTTIEKIHKLTFGMQTSIDDVKSAIYSINGTPVHDQRLYYDGCLLDGATLEAYEIDNDDTLYLFMRQVGC